MCPRNNGLLAQKQYVTNNKELNKRESNLISKDVLIISSKSDIRGWENEMRVKLLNKYSAVSEMSLTPKTVAGFGRSEIYQKEQMNGYKRVTTY